MVASRKPWDTCVPDARNTIKFDNGSVTANTISLYLYNARKYAIVIAEVEIWVPAVIGPRYEAEDGLIGISQQGTAIGLNGSIENGGVRLNAGAILEIADARTQIANGAAGMANVTVIGYRGKIQMGLNYLCNVTVDLPQQNGGNKTVQASMLAGGNVITFFNDAQSNVWIDAFEIS